MNTNFAINFRDTVNPLSLCNTEIETANYYLVRCQLFAEQRTKLFEYLHNLDYTILIYCDDERIQILLKGSCKYPFSTNNEILSLEAVVQRCSVRRCFPGVFL